MVSISSSLLIYLQINATTLSVIQANAYYEKVWNKSTNEQSISTKPLQQCIEHAFTKAVTVFQLNEYLMPWASKEAEGGKDSYPFAFYPAKDFERE